MVPRSEKAKVRSDIEREGGRNVWNGVKQFNQIPLQIRFDKERLRSPKRMFFLDGTLTRKTRGKGNANLLQNLVRSENICTVGVLERILLADLGSNHCFHVV